MAKTKRGREITVGELKKLAIGARVVAFYAKDDDPKDVRIRNEDFELIERKDSDRELELTFRNFEWDDDLLEIEIYDYCRDESLGISLAGRGHVHFYEVA